VGSVLRSQPTARVNLHRFEVSRRQIHLVRSRAPQEDTAEFATSPIVYEIVSADFERREGRLPDGFRELSRRNSFYRIERPIHLFPQYSWSYDRLEVRLEFNASDSDRPKLRPKAFQIFPTGS